LRQDVLGLSVRISSTWQPVGRRVRHVILTSKLNGVTPMSATNYCDLPKATRSTSLQAVNFKDGMIVTADDLATAMRYPLAVFQTLVRAYFGCGIVCGLDVKQVTPAAPPNPNCPPPTNSNYMVCIDRGVALGCDGYPIELCAPINLDLTPDPCCTPRP